MNKIYLTCRLFLKIVILRMKFQKCEMKCRPDLIKFKFREVRILLQKSSSSAFYLSRQLSPKVGGKR